jgi:hypothetical protein
MIEREDNAFGQHNGGEGRAAARKRRRKPTSGSARMQAAQKNQITVWRSLILTSGETMSWARSMRTV